MHPHFIFIPSYSTRTVVGCVECKFTVGTAKAVRYVSVEGLSSKLALAASWPSSHNNVCLHRGDPLLGLFLLVDYFDLCRLEGSHVTATAAVFALPALPPVLTDAFAATILAVVAPPPVLAEAAAAALLAYVAPPPVLAEAAAAALLAYVAPPPVLADAVAAALLTYAALPPVLAEAPPPQSLHCLRCRPCSQMPLPPQSWQ